MKALLKELWEFAKNPNEKKYENFSIKHKFLLLGKILLLDFGFVVVLFPLLSLLDSKVFISDYYEEELYLLSDIILYMIILIPILEELIFRLPLKFKHNIIALLIDKISNGRVKPIWYNYYKYIFYFFVLVFGTLHITKFSNFSLTFLLVSPFLIFSQTVGGFLLSFLRIRIGLIWSVLSHICFNLTIIFIGIVFVHNSSILEISNEKIETFEITSLAYAKYKHLYYDDLIVNDTVFYFRADQYNLQRMLDSLNIENIKLITPGYINAEFRSDTGLTKEEIKEILINEGIIEEIQN